MREFHVQGWALSILSQEYPHAKEMRAGTALPCGRDILECGCSKTANEPKSL